MFKKILSTLLFTISLATLVPDCAVHAMHPPSRLRSCMATARQALLQSYGVASKQHEPVVILESLETFVESWRPGQRVTADQLAAFEAYLPALERGTPAQRQRAALRLHRIMIVWWQMAHEEGIDLCALQSNTGRVYQLLSDCYRALSGQDMHVPEPGTRELIDEPCEESNGQSFWARHRKKFIAAGLIALLVMPPLAMAFAPLMAAQRPAAPAWVYRPAIGPAPERPMLAPCAASEPACQRLFCLDVPPALRAAAQRVPAAERRDAAVVPFVPAEVRDAPVAPVDPEHMVEADELIAATLIAPPSTELRTGFDTPREARHSGRSVTAVRPVRARGRHAHSMITRSRAPRRAGRSSGDVLRRVVRSEPRYKARARDAQQRLATPELKVPQRTFFGFGLGWS